MMSLVVSLGILFAMAAGVILYAVSGYNTLATSRDRVKNAFAQIGVQLRRRYALIPSLVGTARDSLQNEVEVLEAVIPACDAAECAAVCASESPGAALAMRALGDAESVLSGALGQFLGVAGQRYDLMANQEMLNLLGRLTTTEQKIASSRRAYNDAVVTYNRTRKRFPASLVANNFGFAAAELFVVRQPAENVAQPVLV